MKTLFILLLVIAIPQSIPAESFPGGAYLVIGGKFGGEITKQEITENTTLGIEGCAAGAAIYKFTLVIGRDGNSRSFSSESNKLTSDMLAAINSLQTGDEFTFKRVKAHLSDDDDIDVAARPFMII